MSSSHQPVTSFTPFDLSRRARNPLFSSLTQVAYVVPELEPTLETLTEVYGVPGFQVYERPPVSDARFRGKAVDVRITVALGYMDHLNFEVIRPSSDAAVDIYSDFLRERPKGGFHHLGFRVHDYDAAFAHLATRHGEAVQTGRFGSAGTRFAYFDTTPSLGGYTEIVFLDSAAERSDAELRSGQPATVAGGTGPALPLAVARYFAVESTDAEAAARCFTEKASVVDEGKTHRGRKAIARWKADTIRQYRYTTEPLAMERAGRSTWVSARVSGSFPGSPVTLRLKFTLAGDAIERLEIAT
jgi:hypothetical protein